MTEFVIIVNGDTVELRAGLFLVELLWGSSEVLIGFPPFVAVRLQFYNFVHIKWAVLRLDVGYVFSRQDFQVVVPFVLQPFKEPQIYRVADVLADASVETPHHGPVFL